MMSAQQLGWNPDRLSYDDFASIPSLPAMELALSPTAVRNRVRAAIQMQTDVRLLDAKVVLVRLKPERYCHVFYDFTVADIRSGSETTVVAGLKLFFKPVSSGYIRRRVKHLKTQGSLPAYLHFHDLNAVMTFVPGDLKLKMLPHIFSAKQIQTALDRAISLSQRRCVPLENAAIEVASYRPERYCLVRFDQGSSNEQDSIFCRMFAEPKQAAQLHHIMVKLWQFRDSHGLPLAEPLGYDSEQGIAFQSRVAGSTLTKELNRNNLSHYMEAAAGLLSRLHALPIKAPPFCDDAELVSLSRTAESLHCIAPDEFPTVKELVSLLAGLRTTETKSVGFAHGDFSSNQMLVDGDRLGVIDFGSCGVGEQLRDVANFVVRLENHLSADAAQSARRTFVDSYRSKRPNSFCLREFRWQEARACIKGGLLAFRKMHEGWRSRTHRLLGRARDILETSDFRVLS